MTVGEKQRIGDNRCERCGTKLDGARVVFAEEGDHAPKAGDFTLCMTCMATYIFVDSKTLRLATRKDLETCTPEEFAELEKAKSILTSQVFRARLRWKN
jgi:hypothetical protein